MGNPDADKPVARLEIDTRSQGPLTCEDCGEELEHILLMEDGGITCPECRSLIPAFENFSKVIVSAAPVKLKSAGHVCGDRCREQGCKYDFPEEAEDNPGGRVLVVDEEGTVIRSFSSRGSAEKFAEEHNEDRDPGTMEYFVQEGE